MLSSYHRYRIYEILPGLTIWFTLLFSVLLSFFRPLWMIYFILLFDLYWVLRVAYFSFYLLLSWRRFRRAVKINWFERLQKECPNWHEKKNVVFLPIYNEGFEVISATLNSFIESSFPAEKIYVVISGEERKSEHWRGVQKQIREKYEGSFADIIFNTHPSNLPDEIPGKGSNIYSAEFAFKSYADKKEWKYIDIIASVFDVDTIVHPEYFAHLSYMYCMHPRPDHSSFQPLTLYNNNLWESPSILRIMAFGTSFWMLFSLGRLDNLVTFSSHSMSFKAIMDCEGHSKNIVSEDSRIFFQCWFANDGDYEVSPLYIPVSMDTVRDESWLKSLKNLYYQQRRWAWGAEHIPYLLWNFRENKKISLWKKAAMLFHEWEGKWSWAVVAILITLIGRLPLWVAGGEVRQSALFFNAPNILEILMTLAMAGLLVSAIMSMLILPRRPGNHPRYGYLLMVLQWLLLPISLVVFSALPCLDAVTHLMRGEYLGFNVSVKKRI